MPSPYLWQVCRFPASTLPLLGVEAATANLCSIIVQFGDVLGPPKISRVDVFLDFICAVDFDKLDQEYWVTRANLLAKYYDRRIPYPFTGWVVGIGGDLSSRLYEDGGDRIQVAQDVFARALATTRLEGWR